MSTSLSPGKQIPHNVNAIIEIPAHSAPVKYEMDKATGLMSVDRFIATPMFYPANYGYIPNTLSEDGDPLDILVIAPVPLLHGSLIHCRPIGVLAMTDESGRDAKIIAVPHDDLTVEYRDVQSCDDLSPSLKDAITHFFEHYKDLETNKWVKIEGWQSQAVAHQLIMESVERVQS